jgi:capsular polysaccharide transport system permease protein
MMLTPTSFLRSLAIQRRVLVALLMREVITRFGRENLGALWLVAEPMSFTLGVAALWTLMQADHGSSLPIVTFAITGYSSVLMWRNTVGRCIGGIPANANLLYHRNVTVLDVMLTRIVLEMAGTTASFIVLTTLFMLAEWITPPQDPLKIVAGWIMLAWFGAALALLIGCSTALTDTVERFWHPASYLLFPLSGAAFMIDWVPRAFGDAVLWLPMIHAVELVREGFFGNMVRTHYDMAYMATCNLALTFAGLLVLNIAARRVGEKR